MRNVWLFLLMAHSLFAQNGQQLTENTVQTNTIKGHIYFLASDELKGRNTPSPELNIAARYLATSLMRYGVQPAPNMEGYFQKVPLSNPPVSGEFTIAESTLLLKEDFIAVNGQETNLEGELVFIGRGNEADFNKQDVTGKLVVTWAGYEGESNPQKWFVSGGDKRKLAQEKGAIGLIELYNSQRLPWNFLKRRMGRSQLMMEEVATTLPHIWLNAAKTEVVQKLKSADKVTGQLVLKMPPNTNPPTYNVVGMVEGTDPVLKNEYIIYSAHYDHVGIGRTDEQGDSIYNGARDNAVGTVTVLSAAENIAKYPTKRSALFVFFTGEEKGLLGSNWYANHPAIPLDKVVYCFNSDNGGYNDTSIATIVGLTRTTAQEHIEKACSAFGLKAIEDPAKEQGLFDRSDNVNFAKKGVPAPTFSMGFTAFDDEIGKYYHRPGDHPDNLDYIYLTKFFKSYVYSCRLIANAPETPFWREGDKYYSAGKELYNSTSDTEGQNNK